MTVTTSATSGGTSLVLSGNPGTAYVDTSIDVHADVANSLTADRTLRVVVPSPVTVGYATNTTLVGQAGPLTLGTASSTPAAGILGPTTGLPPGTTIAMSGGSVVLTGTPTTAGDYSIATTVGTEWSSAAFARSSASGRCPSSRRRLRWLSCATRRSPRSRWSRRATRRRRSRPPGFPPGSR
ncbi:hypothetical protein GCM10025869_27430 [Homoserinibacter gongjuensis]|uniref:MBG domain-containing protein n=2 Tax=Homoserinibacter gongjuensis TaxID=1162968 RepID=A0ABQ6JYA9_9MICO|nr:hypothetical protein GCM10025869_27430 [Homoserinibacter gongjuensis]